MKLARAFQSPVFAALLFAGFVLLLATGCRSNDASFSRVINEPAPLPQTVRARFGVVGILPVDAASQFQFARPATRGEAANQTGARAFDAALEAGRPDYDEERFNSKTGRFETPPFEESLQQEVASWFFSWHVSLVAALGGMLAGVPEKQIQQGEAAMRAALAEQSMDVRLRRHLERLAARHRAPNFVTIPAAGATNRTALQQLGVTSVLQTRVVAPRFVEFRGMNPPMTFATGVEVRVVRVSDGAVLHTGFLDYRGAQWRFTEWADDNAKRFRKELERAGGTLASTVVDQLFAP